MNDKERGQWTSASSAQADLLCPGRHLAQQQATETLPAEEESEDATFGKRVHAALATGKSDSLSDKEEDLYESCRTIEANLILKAFGPVDPATSKPMREQRLWTKFGDFKHSGQPDAVHRKGTRALIVEFKTLPGDVPHSSKNQQLRDQAVLVWSNTVLLQDIWVAVVQPLVSHLSEPCVYTRLDIEQARLLLESRVRASNNPGSPRLAGETQCHFCRARRLCAEYQLFGGATVPIPLSVINVPIAAWTPEHRKLFLDNEHTARRWLTDCHTALLAMAIADPNAVPGYQLVPGDVVEKISDPQGVFDRFSAMGGTLAEFMQSTVVFKTRLSPFVKAHTGAKGKAVDEAMKKLCEGLVETNQNAPSLKKVKE